MPACIKNLKKHIDWLNTENYHKLNEESLEYLVYFHNVIQRK